MLVLHLLVDNVNLTLQNKGVTLLFRPNMEKNSFLKLKSMVKSSPLTGSLKDLPSTLKVKPFIKMEKHIHHSPSMLSLMKHAAHISVQL